jgi:murein DD-endopeptidase MepM/ murein hydrolase activator NlpD
VIDHGQVDGVGHVATVYAHFESIAPGIEEGAVVAAGQVLGESGNSGTSSGSRGSQDGIHLHWEIYVDDVFLGAGLTPADVGRVYSSLFPG